LLKIGIDIDGVLTDEGPDHDNIWLQKMNNYFDKQIKKVEDTYQLAEAYGLQNEELNAFLEDELANIYREARPAIDACETLKELKAKNAELILITARNKEFKELTLNWLNEHDFPFDELHHNKDKAPLAVKKGIELFIEDNQSNALEISQNQIPVLVVNKYHNKNLKENNKIKRVNNWQEIRKHIFALSVDTVSNKFF